MPNSNDRKSDKHAVLVVNAVDLLETSNWFMTAGSASMKRFAGWILFLRSLVVSHSP